MNSKQGQLLYLSRADVEKTNVRMAEVIDALAAAFREHGLGHTEMPPKPGVHSRPDAFIHAMPAYIPALNAIGFEMGQRLSGQPGQGTAIHQRPFGAQ
jgi:ornithine cyclodeaminase/alanine dehydrogenase